MGWIEESKVVTAEEKLLAKIERNRQKALDAQNKAIEKCEEDDLKSKYGLSAKLTSTEKKDLKDYIIAIQAYIESPDLNEPPVAPSTL